MGDSLCDGKAEQGVGAPPSKGVGCTEEGTWSWGKASAVEGTADGRPEAGSTARPSIQRLFSISSVPGVVLGTGTTARHRQPPYLKNSWSGGRRTQGKGQYVKDNSHSDSH